MKRYSLTTAPSVVEQIRAHVLRIAQDWISHALAWEDRLHEAIRHIADAPGLAIDESASARLGYTVRKCVFENT